VNVPNMVIVAVGAGGQISLFNESGNTHLLVDVLGWFPTTTVGASTIRASVKTGGANAEGGSDTSSVSADGRYVVYQSTATDLVAGDTNGTGDIFLFDRQTVTTTRVSVDSANGQANGESTDPMISANGRYVVFASFADNIGIVPDTNSARDVYVRDLQLSLTYRVSVGAAGVQAIGHSSLPTISDDGQFISFISTASNLVGALDTNGFNDVFVRDQFNSVTTRVSVSTAGVQADAQSDRPKISGNGRYVSFASFATNLVADDTSLQYDIFVRDRTLNTTTRVSVSSAGVEQNSGSLDNAISGDGRYVIFRTDSTNLVAGDTNLKADIFRHDSVTGITVRVSVDSAGGQLNQDSDVPSISADGRYILFETFAAFVPGDTNNNYDVFVHDMFDATTVRVGVSTAGTESVFGTARGSISANGRFVTFYSSGGDLVTGDTNAFNDVFLRDRGTV
ncbi:MAG: hypothetical protein K8R99_01710, partial [Actinomycetia bacterium]|nr:hypothetical protein [Actinomycetes bacterium]